MRHKALNNRLPSETIALMLLLFLLQAAAPEPPPSPDSLRPLFSVEDYPREAVRNGWQGDVRVDPTIGTNGRAKDCKVIRSSGYKVLDDATCRIFLTRARFKPSTDDAGHAVEDHYETHIDWRLSTDQLTTSPPMVRE
jgi:TonB family protein